MQSLQEEEGVIRVTADQCGFGLKSWGRNGEGPVMKPIGFLTNSVCIALELERKCPNRGHKGGADSTGTARRAAGADQPAHHILGNEHVVAHHAWRDLELRDALPAGREVGRVPVDLVRQTRVKMLCLVLALGDADADGILNRKTDRHAELEGILIYMGGKDHRLVAGCYRTAAPTCRSVT